MSESVGILVTPLFKIPDSSLLGFYHTSYLFSFTYASFIFFTCPVVVGSFLRTLPWLVSWSPGLPLLSVPGDLI